MGSVGSESSAVTVSDRMTHCVRCLGEGRCKGEWELLVLLRSNLDVSVGSGLHTMFSFSGVLGEGAGKSLSTKLCARGAVVVLSGVGGGAVELCYTFRGGGEVFVMRQVSGASATAAASGLGLCLGVWCSVDGMRGLTVGEISEMETIALDVL